MSNRLADLLKEVLHTRHPEDETEEDAIARFRVQNPEVSPSTLRTVFARVPPDE